MLDEVPNYRHGTFGGVGDQRAQAFAEGEVWAFIFLPNEDIDIAGKRASGEQFAAPLAPLLQHVVNHATHHRSELVTMITLISGSPPDTGLATYRATVVKG